MPEDRETTAQLVRAARLYYTQQLSQQQIAGRLGISRPGVSRLLQKARDLGIVRIDIVDPAESATLLEQGLCDRFSLQKAIVVPDHAPDAATLQKRLALATAELLDTLLEKDSILGVSWGTTMMAVTRRLRPRRLRDMVVVQLNGGISRAAVDTHATEIAQRIGDHYSATPYLMPLPAIVDSPALKQGILSDSNISRTLDLGRQAPIALFTVGSFGPDSILVAADYFQPTEVDQLLAQGAVGDICSRLINNQGGICDPDLDARTIGLELEELRSKPWSIAVAGGRGKQPAIAAALRGHWFNTLITDEDTAQNLLDMEDKA